MAIYSGNNLVATKGGVSNYSDLDNKPSINDVILVGNKTLDDLNIASKDSIPVSTSQLTNDSGFITTIPEEYVTDTELDAKNYVTNSSLAVVATSGSYADVTNKPQINSITLDGNKTLTELGIAASSDLSTIATSGSYNDAENKPQINSVELTGNKTSEELGLQDLDTALNYNNITNCITKIPQDIKLELNNGTLTLKSGSKVYKGDGTVINITSDRINNDTSKNGQYFICINVISQSVEVAKVSTSTSGADKGDVGTFSAWYDTTNKIVYRYGGDISSGYEVSLPIAIVTMDSTGTKSIDQVFNGFGYIGNTIFALPGVEGLAPNGFNIDGTYNNTIFTLNKVIFGEAATSAATQLIQATLNGILLPSAYSYKIFNNKKEVLDFIQLASTMSFDCYIINENKQYYYNQNNTPIFSQNNRFECGTIETDGERIISFKPSYAFAAININQIENIIADTPTSIYQKMFNVPGVTISLQTDKSIYKLSNISVNMHLTFGMGSLKKVYTDRVITFELYIPVTSTVPTITWPSTVTWLNNEVPTFEANTNYLLAFRSFDQGVNWIGNMQCSWPNA